ncbi:hypothetical protein C7E18_24485, partial [Stenotrophomonas maltophilia]
MLERMFIGNPAPLHDRILDFSTATSRRDLLRVIEKMLERMFIGNPAPLHDRILDFSTATSRRDLLR